MQEVWKDVVGFEDYFKVSNLGRVFSKRTSKLLKLRLSDTGGYPCFSTRIGGRSGKCYVFKVHRLVAQAFLPPPDAGIVAECIERNHGLVPVNHKDGVKTNNHVSNLEWCTAKQNAQHAVRLGINAITNRKGLDNPNFTLSREIVDFIIENHIPRCRRYGARALSRLLGVPRCAVDLAVKLYSKQK